MPLEPSGVLQLVHELAYRARLEKKVSPHTFRHSYITWALSKNMNIEVIRRIVGHADTSLISTVYGHLVATDLHEATVALMSDER
jgi:integrase/recombinase XerD